MADLISFETLVDNLNDELNTLSTTLYSNSKIAREIQVAIAPHYQDNEEPKEYASDTRIAGIALRATGEFAPSQKFQSYSDSMLLSFDAFTNDADDMDYLLNEYANQNSGKFITDTDWVYYAEFGRPTFFNRSEDKGEQRIVVQWDITYRFIYKGILADDILLKINDVEVPVITYSTRIEKQGVSTDTNAAAGIVKTKHTKGTTSRYVKFIHINNTELNKLLEDIDTAEYLNRTYTVFYGMKCDENGLNCTYSKEHTMVLNSGTVEFTEGGFQTIEATFLIYNSV